MIQRRILCVLLLEVAQRGQAVVRVRLAKKCIIIINYTIQYYIQ
jgi:hypothetical protein